MITVQYIPIQLFAVLQHNSHTKASINLRFVISVKFASKHLCHKASTCTIYSYVFTQTPHLDVPCDVVVSLELSIETTVGV